MSQAQESHAQRWARLRFSIIGPLLAAPPESRELASRITELASKSYRHPSTGQPVRFGASTIERWFYRARNVADPMRVLRRRVRSDRGTQPGIDGDVRSLIVTQHRANPDWTFQLLYDNVAVVAKERKLSATMPSYPTVVRFMHAQGLRRQPSRRRLREGEVKALERKQKREVRSFEVAHVHALWHLDFHVSSRKLTTPDGRHVAPHLFCVLDDCSRLVCHAQWYWSESAECLVHGLTQAMQKRGLPRSLLTDNGAAMTAEETTNGLATLGILHDTTLPYSPYQNGKQEVFWNQVEGRLLPMLGDEKQLTLEALNDATIAWVEMEYQRRVHRELSCSPIERYLAGPTVGRPCAESAELRRAFTMQCTRVVRQSDGTVSIDGKRFEVPSRLRALRMLTVRYARWNLAHMWAIDGHTEAVLAPLYLLDKAANSDRLRRSIVPTSAAKMAPATSEPMAPLMRELMRQYAASGIPPAYLAGPTPTTNEVSP